MIKHILLLVVSSTLLALHSPKHTCVSPQTAHTGDPIASETGSSTQPTPTPYSQSPLDPSVQQLPPSYRGASIEQLVSQLDQPRGEFETTAQYQARMSNRAIAGTYGFVLEQERAFHFEKYDPDTQTFGVNIYRESFVSRGIERDHGSAAILVKEMTVSEREYPASNAFGATVTVTSTTSNVYAVIPSARPRPEAPGRIPIISLNMDRRDPDCNVPVPLEEAPTAKGYLRVMLVVGLAGSPDTVVSGTDISAATISAPYSWIKTYKYIRGDLLAIWIYNFANGKIYLKSMQ